MRFQPVRPPDAPHAGLADTSRRSHGARAPVSRVGRLLARGHGHHAFAQAATDGGLASGPERVFLQPRHAQRQESLAPAGNFFRRNGQAGGDFQVLQTGGCQQHDASALRHPHREGSAPGLA